MFRYVLFIAANYYPKAYLMYPSKQHFLSFVLFIIFCLAAALVGLSAAPLWTSKGSYLTDLGSVYASDRNLDKNAVINRFFGIFFTFFQSCTLS